MRIALITPGFSADERDWCIPVLLNLVRELAREHEVHVFTLRYPHCRGTYQVHRVAVHAFSGAAAAGLDRLPLMARALASVVRQHRRGPFDVLHGLWADEPGFLAVLGGRLLGPPSAVSLLGGELVSMPEIGYGGQLSRVNRWLVRTALRRTDVVTAGSTYLSRLAHPHVAPERLELLSLGVDAGMFYPGVADPDPLAEGEIKLLHVGSLTAVKDQNMLLRAFSLIAPQFPDAYLHIVGGGNLRSDLENLAVSLGIGEQVVFHGAVSHERLPDYYRAADLCLFSSRYESQGMVVLEAAACECALVGTAVGLLPELVPGVLAVPVGDVEALAEGALRLLQDKAKRAEVGRAARERVEAQYTLAHTVDALLALYGRLVEK
ncbi:MAG: glycosyltransferase family 4 protein [Anaerolineales bacterium]|jgi:glycosyltransferase involved in cell wall biosynthesis